MLTNYGNKALTNYGNKALTPNAKVCPACGGHLWKTILRKDRECLMCRSCGCVKER